MDRRRFLQLGLGAALGGGIGLLRRGSRLSLRESSATFAERKATIYSAASAPPPAFSIIPVVGDGKWIWTKPPAGRRATSIRVPTAWRSASRSWAAAMRGRSRPRRLCPCPVRNRSWTRRNSMRRAARPRLRSSGPQSRQLCLAVPQIADGQVVSAVARYNLTLYKQYHAYRREQFPAEQTVPSDVRQAVPGRQSGHSDPHAGGPQIAG